MKYALLHTLDESAFANTAECGSREALDAWVQEMEARGIALEGARLCPVSDATTVRRRDGRTLVQDGPFAETKEQIAGYDVVDCRDLDEAVAVAAAHPTTRNGSIEVRPFTPGLDVPDIDESAPAGRQRYLMFVCTDPGRPASTANEDAEAGAPQGIDAWVEGNDSRGIRLYGWELEGPERAVTVRRVDGSAVTMDGPFAETKEQICGFDLLECRDLDEAIAVAAAHPMSAGGLLELRPLWP